MPAGYSGTPLAKKLGFKPGLRIAAVGAPPNYQKLLAPLPEGVEFVREPMDAPYGRVAVFKDLYGTLWDLIGPKPL